MKKTDWRIDEKKELFGYTYYYISRKFFFMSQRNDSHLTEKKFISVDELKKYGLNK